MPLWTPGSEIEGGGPGTAPPQGLSPAPAPTTTVWTVQVWMPAGGKWLTDNPSASGIGHRYARAALVRDWRDATCGACHRGKLPRNITPVRIHAVVIYIGRRPVRDRMNLSALIKAVVDGLTPARTVMRKTGPVHSGGYGFLPDDSDKHVLATTWDLRPATPGELKAAWGRVDLTLTHESPPQ